MVVILALSGLYLRPLWCKFGSEMVTKLEIIVFKIVGVYQLR